LLNGTAVNGDPFAARPTTQHTHNNHAQHQQQQQQQQQYGRTVGRSVQNGGGFLIAEDEADDDGYDDDDDDDEDGDVDALPPVEGEEVDLATALEEAMKPGGGRRGSQVNHHMSSANSHATAARRRQSVHDLEVELSAEEAERTEPDEDAVDQLRGGQASPTAELEALDARHEPVKFFDGMSPRPVRSAAAGAGAGASEARPRAPSAEEVDEALPSSVEPRSSAQEKSMALRIAERMLGTKAQRAAARTREAKEAPLRAWLLACSDASSAWSCTTLGSCINGLPEYSSPARTEVFGTNHLSVTLLCSFSSTHNHALFLFFSVLLLTPAPPLFLPCLFLGLHRSLLRGILSCSGVSFIPSTCC
jgi:hypothetical protein